MKRDYGLSVLLAVMVIMAVTGVRVTGPHIDQAGFITVGQIDSTSVKDGSLSWGDMPTTVTPFAKTLLDDAANTNARSTLGLGTIATQAANNVNIDGGEIDGTAIGANSRSTGAFTTLAAIGLTLTLDGDDLELGQYSGIVDSLTAGENLAAGDLVYQHSNGKWLKAQSDSVESANAEMVALESISANSVGLGMRYGYIKLYRWDDIISGNYLAGPMYVSAGSAGYITASIPASAGNVIVPIGSGGGKAGLLFFNPPAKGIYVVR